MASSSSTTAIASGDKSDKFALYPSLKFVVSNLKSLVPHHLSSENYQIWRNQILKLFKANGFEEFLEPMSASTLSGRAQDQENQDPNVSKANWILTDQNLAAAICSTISAPVLPYIMHLETSAEIWQALQTRFQSSSRSKVIQLKNELHNLSMNTLSMQAYLAEIKKLVDNIASAGAKMDTEDIILHIMNGLPASYQSFKTYIRTMQNPLTLDALYALLISEEIHVQADSQRLAIPQDTQTALYSNRGRGRRGRGRPSQPNQPVQTKSAKSSLVCQICTKRGHTADVCWHRHDANYVTPRTTPDTSHALLATSDSSSTDWYLDSGASSHMTNRLDNLTQSSIYNGNDQVTVGDGRSVPIAHSGTGLLPTPDRKLRLSNLLHIPSISYNLLSISNLVKENQISITFDPNGYVFKDLQTQTTLFRGPCRNGLYPLSSSSVPHQHKALSTIPQRVINWHFRLGHPHSKTMQAISTNNPQLHIPHFVSNCSWCKSCKSHKMSFVKSIHRSTQPLALLHSDVWGPSPVSSHQGLRYYLIIVDDYSHYTWIFPCLLKSDVSQLFMNFILFIENQMDSRIKVIRTDGGKEYVNNIFSKFLQSKGIQHQTSCPYTPEQNGVAERKHRHVVETARTLLHTASMPLSYWPEAINTAVYIINRLPSPTTNNIPPLKLMFNITPEYSHLRTFGCECFPLLPPHTRTKLHPNSVSCIFIGYSDTQKGYRCLNKNTNRIYTSRHVQFSEDSFPFKHNVTTLQQHTQHVPAPLLVPISTLPQTNKPCQTTSNNAPFISSPQLHTDADNRYSMSPPSAPNTSIREAVKHPMVTRTKTGSLKPICRLNLLHCGESAATAPTPTSYNTASKHLEWRNAMASEFLALQQQGTWCLVPPPSNASILGSRWTFRKKFNEDGSIARFKARLVAQGNHQEFGLHYGETFSPVAKFPTIRILFTVALYHGWQVQQLDVSNAFLHGNLEETIFMKQPKGFEDTTYPNHVCHLQKALYGLKQAPRQWYNTLTTYLISIGFNHSKADPSLLTLHRNSTHIYLLVYVDDILITGNDTGVIFTLIQSLGSRFMLKQLGPAKDFLGIHIQSSSDKFFLSQSKYALCLFLNKQI
ncbi:Retrovirus-related Pol polyprotein from transposon TNT 1-94 [Dendrobium catenatum]|uniref:Retrovirus-related Pol polyprotein from transposon TNT 1-94 n=1 Tax=Dendrobium catenatum TaxID=906689 RepID=A0A2I0VBZ4_9ASPA|nr:Retrovirus-related Pol polyprotein from transposon TNT 1-94 [Dendrobium catenatum]